MRGFSQLRREAHRQLRALTVSARRDLSAGRPVDFDAIKKDVDTLTAVITMRAPWERLIYAAVPALLAIIALAGGWLIRVPAPEVQVEVTAKRVTLALVEPDAGSSYALNGFPQLKRLLAQNLESIGSD